MLITAYILGMKQPNNDPSQWTYPERQAVRNDLESRFESHRLYENSYLTVEEKAQSEINSLRVEIDKKTLKLQELREKLIDSKEKLEYLKRERGDLYKPPPP